MIKKHVRWGLCAGSLGMVVAANADVQIYGMLVPSYEYVWSSGGTTQAPSDRPNQINPAWYKTGAHDLSTTRINQATSNIGFRGSDKITENLEVFWQVENGINFSGGTSNWASRNSGVGLRGSNIGTFLIGNWDTPYAWSTIGVGTPVRNPYTGDFSNVMQNAGFGNPITTTQSGYKGTPADTVFNRRAGNSVQYWTPKWNGFSARFAYSMGDGKTTLANKANVDPKIYSLALEYADKGWLVRYAYSQHKDYFGLSWLGGSKPNEANSTSTVNSSKDEAHKLFVRYSFENGLKLIGMYENLKYSSNDKTQGNIREYDRDAIYGLVWYTTGKHHVWGGAGMAFDGSCKTVGNTNCSTNDMGAYMWQTGYRYDLSKRSDVYAAIYGVHNKENGTYAVWPRLSSTATRPGMDYYGVSVGLETSF